MRQGKFLVSRNGNYTLWVEGDGNVVIYRRNSDTYTYGDSVARGDRVWDLQKYGAWPSLEPGPYALSVRVCMYVRTNERMKGPDDTHA